MVPPAMNRGTVTMQRVRLNKPAPDPLQLIRIKEVARLLSVNLWTVRRLVAKGDFPKPIRVTPTIPAWRKSDVEAWLKAREGVQP